MSTVQDLSGIVYSCYTEVSRAGEQFIEEHGLSYIVSGNLEAFDGEKTHRFNTGEIILYKKNTLAKFVKQPAENKPFESVSLLLDKDILWAYNEARGSYKANPSKELSPFYTIRPDKLSVNYFKSLHALFEEKIPDELITLKKQEAVILLLRSNPALKDVLFDFSMPGKIDLEAFMNQNYKFNVPLPRLAYLTGRSLASFKRDFEKTYHMSPNRWMQNKRLHEAHFLLSEKKMKPIEVFSNVGFETLSHFSYAFKQQFGINPSAI
ncbi:helix-turn-helix domain-containing protein [Pedobacter antarcticus]|uniref:AraC family transcriptional regulator n=2 Tax=Pedobacter antarcticus TaxID=34086 RepID=A0A081PD01_9SPHI|nr:AraC family transcriptional regulator [Pedobacter antarcticus]KEQ28574.1 AraC family transcriptional regulator [Pedobacter antarcticus 4BY]SDL49348.1 AraC-type DNA-binding protein [Pedobacter antarcticus]SFE35999.1 AraC-type DNA-binding protein [Pedobacter antarcticus]